MADIGTAASTEEANTGRCSQGIHCVREWETFDCVECIQAIELFRRFVGRIRLQAKDSTPDKG